MTYKPDEVQLEAIEADDPVLLVLGGAGTGKTTTAAAAVRSHLERLDRQRPATIRPRTGEPLPRALFLSFSRSSVAQVLDRSASVLESYLDRVEVTTFHAFAWKLLKRWGYAIGMPNPKLLSETEAKLFIIEGAIRFKELLPRALQLCAVPAVREHLQARWSIIVSDEFQDTSDDQFELLTTIRGKARLLLLGDLNQCIYSELPGTTGVGPERLAAALSLPGARQLDLPEGSHRDPSNFLPTAAASIRRRDFTSDAVNHAITTGRLKVRAGLTEDDEADEVAAVVEELMADGSTVGVFSHHIDATTALSDELGKRGIDHEVIGLPECLASALRAQNAMVQFAGSAVTWEEVMQFLALFVTSSVRGEKVPKLAWMLLGQAELPAALTARLDVLRSSLADVGSSEAARLAAAAHTSLGLPRGQRHWQRAGRLLAPMAGRAHRLHSDPDLALAALGTFVDEHHTDLLTSGTAEPNPQVQIMGLYQTKGREADATVVVLRSTDWYGPERLEPFETGSRLLYVVLTRARKRTVVLLLGHGQRPLVAPLVQLAG